MKFYIYELCVYTKKGPTTIGEVKLPKISMEDKSMNERKAEKNSVLDCVLNCF